MNLYITRTLTKLAIAVAAFIAPVATQANTFTLHVDLNVSSLIGAPNSPFFLDFQLNEGSGTVPNSATISGFQFTGGSPSGSATTFGLASGNLGSSVTLSDNPSSPFNELFQGFTSSTTDIQFYVGITQNTAGVTPDGFIVSILDSETNNPPIGTTDSTNSSMLTATIDNPMTLGDVHTFTSTSPAGATAVATPEPGSLTALVGGAGCLLALRRRRAQAVS